MKIIRYLLTMMAAGMLFSAPLFAQTFYYVQSASAKVMSGPTFKSAVLLELKKGEKVASTGKEGNWVRVKTGDREGYVPALLISTHPPFEKTGGLIKADDAEIKQGVRRRASSYTSAAAARGLAQDNRRRLSREEKADYQALEEMESVSVNSEEVNRFLEASK